MPLDEPSLRALPLFPLSTVLFPGGLLPLRIFEVRYLDMVRRCHDEGTPFGVVALVSGSEVRQAGAASEVFHDVGTLAHIVALDSPQAGIVMIQCSGSRRFRIARREQLRHGLWIADAEPMENDKPVRVPEDLKPDADALLQLIDNLQKRHAGADMPELPLSPPWHPDDCGWVSNRWCELLPLSVELKQQLMALDNPMVRLELVGDILARNGMT